MALVPAGDGAGDTNLRIYKQRFGCQYSSREEEAEHRSRLRAKIHNAYCKAFERLAKKSKARGSVLGGGGGFCFGLLDPASNIIVNIHMPCKRDPAAEKLQDMERRSLDGMVTFLTRFFPYLADCEAVRYLLLADADALIAARIVVMDRRMKRFGASEPEGAVGEALEMALKCAALAAGHPDTDRFVGSWLTISSRLDEAVSLVGKVRRRSPSSALQNLKRLLGGPSPPADDRCKHLWRPWQLAASRRPRPRFVPYQNTSTPLRRALLDAIHGFYLQAIARLPAGELRSRFHRSLIKAGHCYGPLDPVSNIILNTIWYDAAFPPAMRLELDMVSTPGLHRIEVRSLYGLVSFLCTRYHHLKFHRATRCLLEADGNLLLADPNLNPEAAAAAIASLRMEERGRFNSPWSTFHNAMCSRVDAEARIPAASVNEAFKAAATAAWHPHPDAQAHFLNSCMPMLESAMALLHGGAQLTSEDVQRLARLLCPEPPCEKPHLPEFKHAYTGISEKVKAALSVYASMSGEELTYEIHAICGVNDQVSGPVFCPESDACPPQKFYRSHVNFLVTSKGPDCHAEGPPVLFFAEISNEEKAEVVTRSFCCPVWMPPPCAERVRCLYCDYVGTRIVHPIGKNFHGREEDFEKMVCKEDPYDEYFNPVLMPQYYTNTTIIGDSGLMAEMIGALEEDHLYADSCGLDGHKESDEESDESDSDFDYEEC